MGQAPEPPTPAGEGGSRNDSILTGMITLLGRQAVGSPAWAAAFRGILRYYTDPELRGTVSATLLNAIENTTTAALQQNADATRPILEEAGFPITDDVEGWQDAFNGLLDAVEAGLGGSSGLVRDIRETVTENVDQFTTQTRTQDVTTAITTDVTDISRVTRFVDLPTAEKLLDDFDRIILEHVDTLWRAGDINRATRDFFTQNPGFLWTDYIAEQTRRIKEGEEPFRAVGAEGPQVRIGSRPGEAVEQEITTLISQHDVGTLTIEDVIERTIDRLTEQAGTQDGGVVDTDLRQAITEEVTSTFNQFDTTTQRTEAIRALTLMTVEEIITRPQLEAVATFSPSDFITGRFTPTELMNLAVAVPGQQAAARQQPFGVAPSAPRRLA